MELPAREEVAHEGSGHVDTVGVTGSNPVSRTISSPALQRLTHFHQNKRFDCNTFLPDGLIQMQASDVVFADDDGCLFVKSEMSTSYWQLPGPLAAATRESVKVDGVARTTRLRPVTARSEQPIQSHVSRSPAKHRRRRFLLLRPRIPVTDSSCAGDAHSLHPDINPTSSTRLGSSLTISGARQGWRWL